MLGGVRGGLSGHPPTAVCPSGESGGQPVCLSTHPPILRSHLTLNLSQRSLEPVPSDPLAGNVMKGLFIIL